MMQMRKEIGIVEYRKDREKATREEYTQRTVS